MNYNEYLKLQIETESIKPIKYHIGEWLAMNKMVDVPVNSKILDVGCGNGYGVGMLRLMGYWDVLGINIHPTKIEIGKKLGYNVIHKDLKDFTGSGYDAVWCSHAFEHMYDPEESLRKLIQITKSDAVFYFVLPYPNLEPAPAHCGSRPIGLAEDDNGWSVCAWFSSRGLDVVSHNFDKFREPEIWMTLKKRQ